MSHNRLTQLLKQLESYPDVVVLDAVYEGDGLYSLKLQTPRNVYLDTGTFREWIDLAQGDIRQSQQPWYCPFCHHQLPHPDHAPDSPLSCPGCSALGWRIDRFPSDVPQMIYDQFCARWAPAQAYQALIRQNSVFILQETPHGSEFLWIDPPSLKTMPAAEEWPQEAPGCASNPSSPCELPVYLDLNWTDIPEPDAIPHTVDELQAELSSSTHLSPYQLPTCFTCRHVLTVPGPSFDGWEYFCQHPLTHLQPFIEQDMIGYASINLSHQSLGQRAANQLQNLLLDHVLQYFSAIDDDALEGYVPSLNLFHSPICSQYHENPDALDFDDLMKVPVTLPVTFGVVNVAKHQQQKRLENAQKLLSQTIQRFTTLNRDPDAHRLMTLRITKTNLESLDARSVIDFMREHIPRDLLLTPYVQNLKRFFNVSNAAWIDLIESLSQN